MNELTFGIMAFTNAVLLLLLVALMTGTLKLKVELVLPTMKLAPVQMTMNQPRGYIVSKRIKGIPRSEINRFTRSYSSIGWTVSLVEWTGNGEVDATLSRFEQQSW